MSPTARELDPDGYRELPDVPAPAMPREVVTDWSAPWVPSSARTLAKLCQANGRPVAMTRAIGPRLGARGDISEADSRTVAVAAVVPAGRIVAVWRWMKTKWAIDDVQTFPSGRLISMNEAKEMVRHEA